MEIGETIYVTTRQEFRRWLHKHHADRSEIWLIRYKKVTGKPSLDYVQAVEEAICYGWIDNIEKSIDAERFALRFSPRRPKSNWTATNLERARAMIEKKKMTRAGLATLPAGAAPPRKGRLA
ncbi:MAG TPA: hypothetical protein VFH29_09935 [Anaerolineales bacterium]|nr:hypothetical protein [Anaerolineales bacterium]